MKVGTDGVLLGAWCGVENLNSSKTILDIGCGTGLLALMLAQRSGADRIEAVDIDSGAVTDAEENFAASPWSDRLFVHLDSIQLLHKPLL